MWKYNLELLKKRVMGCVTDQVKSYGVVLGTKSWFDELFDGYLEEKKSDFYGV